MPQKPRSFYVYVDDPESKEHRLASGTWRLPITQVEIDAEGKLKLLGPVPIGPGEVNDAWWEDVLEDPRARRRRVIGSWDTIDRYPNMTYTVSCEKCHLNKTFPTNDLIERFGLETPVSTIAMQLATSCSGRPKWCKRRVLIQLPNGNAIERL